MYVYKLYDDEDLIYIGKTVNIQGRVAAHSKDKIFNKVLILTCKDNEEAIMVEALLIYEEVPPLNTNLNLELVRKGILKQLCIGDLVWDDFYYSVWKNKTSPERFYCYECESSRDKILLNSITGDHLLDIVNTSGDIYRFKYFKVGVLTEEEKEYYTKTVELLQFVGGRRVKEAVSRRTPTATFLDLDFHITSKRLVYSTRAEARAYLDSLLLR